MQSRKSKNSKANRIETMKGPAESGQICSVGRRKIAKKIAKNKRCYANTLRPRSRMLLKMSGLLRAQPLGEIKTEHEDTEPRRPQLLRPLSLLTQTRIAAAS